MKLPILSFSPFAVFLTTALLSSSSSLTVSSFDLDKITRPAKRIPKPTAIPQATAVPQPTQLPTPRPTIQPLPTQQSIPSPIPVTTPQVTAHPLPSATPTPNVSAQPTSTSAPTSTINPTPTPNISTELLSLPWQFNASSGGASEQYQTIDAGSLQRATNLTLTYDLNGHCILGGDASAIIFDQGGEWHYVSLDKYGKNCHDGEQTVTIPLADFPGLNPSQPVGTFHGRFWLQDGYSISIARALLVGSVVTSPTSTPTTAPTPSVSPTPVPTSAPSVTPVPQPTTSAWQLRSVDAMKETKDRICGQRDSTFVSKWVATAKELGATHVAISTPYDNPGCGDAFAYTKLWSDTIHAAGLNVWHRHMALEFEGIYDKVKDPAKDYISMMATYIQSHPDIFAEGDIFTPSPEPQNGGIRGVSYCAQNICMFDSAAHFNHWLRNAMVTSRHALSSIGLGDNKVKVGYFGFDGFIAWGDNNPDWQGKGFLEDATVSLMGNITIDHYPELIGSTMEQDLEELHNRFPQAPIIIGEWGTVTGGDIEQQVRVTMTAALKPYVTGFNYWHMGAGGQESLINEDFSKNAQFDEVAQFFK